MTTQTQAALQSHHPGVRKRLDSERRSITQSFRIAGHRGYLTVSMYPDGRPGEIFLRMAKSGSTLSGLLDSLAIAVSFEYLQYSHVEAA